MKAISRQLAIWRSTAGGLFPYKRMVAWWLARISKLIWKEEDWIRIILFFSRKSGQINSTNQSGFPHMPSLMPTYMQARHSIRLPPIFNNPSPQWPACKRWNVSLVKVEKVLKPPQKPVISMNL